jgi:hypothetical protein
MNVIFPRQREQFQHKVQQKINLADDEIRRLSTYLSGVRADTFDVRDRLNRKTIQVAQLSHLAVRREKRDRTSADTLIAKVRQNHHLTMQEAEEKQKREISAMYCSFQETLAGLEGRVQRNVASKIDPIEALLSKAETEYRTFQGTVASSEASIELESVSDVESLHQLDFSRERRLEAILEARSQERLEALLKWKGRLADCVAALEETEPSHAGKVASLRTQLEAMDAGFTARAAREKERQQRSVEGLNKKAAEFEKYA